VTILAVIHEDCPLATWPTFAKWEKQAH